MPICSVTMAPSGRGSDVTTVGGASDTPVHFPGYRSSVHDAAPGRPTGHPTPRADGILVRDPRRTALAALAMLAAVAALTIVVATDVAEPPLLQQIDDAWRGRVLAWPSWTRSLGDWFEQAGAAVVMVPLRLAVAGWLLVRRRRLDLAAWLLGWLLADALTAVLKPGLARERPTPIDPSDPFTAFPSAHAKTAAQVAIGLVLVATSPARARSGWYALAAAWIVLMALSRTVVDHHWLSDVAAGSLLGAACMLAAAAVIQVHATSSGTATRPGPPVHDASVSRDT
jgi:membrane-associated phospholipid phosphatase